MPSAAQRIAQSAFHWHLTAPPVTLTSVSRSLLSGSRKTIVPASGLRSTIGTCSTAPLFGEIGRNGE